jgi:NAD(P)-dependent dehydrogenase (short-subunit alcohol dehydrogenase family)
MAESHLALHSAAVSRSLPEYSNPSDRTFVRIVITGASGNLGTALLRRLAADADTHQVVGVVRRPLVDAGPPYDAVDWVGVDLAEPDAHAQLAPAMAGADAVVHLAWGFQPSHNIAYLDRVGLAGTNAVVSAADAAGVPHLVHLSSLGAYSPGRDDDPVDESWPTEGIDSLAYSKEKVAAERLLDAYQAEHPDGMTVTRIRPALVVQRDAGSALLRYGLPAYVPAGVVRYLPVLPVDRDLVIRSYTATTWPTRWSECSNDERAGRSISPLNRLSPATTSPRCSARSRCTCPGRCCAPRPTWPGGHACSHSTRAGSTWPSPFP